MSVSIQPKLVVSQNFFKDPSLVASLIDRCSISPDDIVYEIGPGKGIITIQLARRCKKVIAIEKDPTLSTALQRRFARQPNVVIRTGDFLSYSLPNKPYKVFSNIPFNITTEIVTRLTGATKAPEDSYLVMQKEAASMYLGRPRESLRSVLLKPWFELDIVHQFQRHDFAPRPHVDCVLLRIYKQRPPLVRQIDRQLFRDFVVYGFTAWRPTLGDILDGVFSFKQLKQISQVLDIDLGATPTTLRFEQWLSLFETFKDIGSPRAAGLIFGSEACLLRQQGKLQKVHRTRKR